MSGALAPSLAGAPRLDAFSLASSTGPVLQWRLTFSEPVTGLRVQDVGLAGNGAFFTGAQVTALAPEGNGASWLLAVMAGPGEGSITPSFTGAAVQAPDGKLLAGRFQPLPQFSVPANVPLLPILANDDVIPDIVTGDTLRLGLGDGRFAAPSALAGGITNATPLAIDGNGDGRQDIVLAGATAAFLARLPGGSFAPAVALDLGGPARAWLAGDVNGDGLADIVAVPDSGAIRLALALAGGGFAPASVTAAQLSISSFGGAALGDVNADGRADLVTLNGEVVALWLGQASGGFAAGGSWATGPNGNDVTLADVNGDARLDLLTQGARTSVRLGDGLGGFGARVESDTAIPDHWPPRLPLYGLPSPVPRFLSIQAALDWNGDGRTDLLGTSHLQGFFFGTYYVDEAFILPGLGDGSFGTPFSLTTDMGQFRALADLDSDGRLDILSARLPTQSLGGGTTLGWQATIQKVPTVYGPAASFYTPPQLVSITADMPDAVLTRGADAIITLGFDKPVSIDAGTYLRLDNGGIATWFGGVGAQWSFRYTAAEGQASRDVDILGIAGGFRAPDSGLAALISAPLDIPGTLQVATRTPLYFANADGRLAMWALDGLMPFDKAVLSFTAGLGALTITHWAGSDSIFYRGGTMLSVSTAGVLGGFGTRIGFADDRWSFAGAGGDGGRVFWYSNAGELVFWDMTGGAGSPRAWLGQASLDWKVRAIADVTGDGAADVLWQNEDSRVAIWRMEGNAATTRAVVDTPGPGWVLAGAADFNADGKADLLYRNSADGQLMVRLMHGLTPIGNNELVGGATTDWSVAGLKDMNGDGRADVLWRNGSGDFAVWLMDGTRAIGKQLLDPVTPDWQLLNANVIAAGAVIRGTDAADQLAGGPGDDRLEGLGSGDVLRGQAGNDILVGGAGNDQLVGGPGADVFVFAAPGWGYDQVFDFARAQGDKLDMRGSGATSLADIVVAVAGGNTAFFLGADRIDVYGVTDLVATDFIFV